MIEKLVETLDLMPHPEGGFFKETYRDPRMVEINDQKRNVSTNIYYLLGRDDFSAWHKLKLGDEIWHYYEGSSLTIHTIDDNGVLKSYKLGSISQHGENARPQILIPKGVWFCAKPDDKNSYTLVGCTVSPGFDFSDFVLADREELLHQYPQHEAIINEFTRVNELS